MPNLERCKDCSTAHVVPHRHNASAPPPRAARHRARAKRRRSDAGHRVSTSHVQQPTKNANETFVRTPFIGDGYFNDEMGELFEYTVQVGDSVAADDTVAVVDTHKASVDIRTPVAGTVSGLLAEPGDKMWEIQPILTLISDVPSSSPRVKMKSEVAIDRGFKVPVDARIGARAHEATLAAVRH